jgi:CRISPR-associated protein (TIGR03984 family)
MKPDIITDCGEVQFASNDELKTWLSNSNLTYLLAHADDGVIWGRFDNGKLTTANEVFTKPDFNFPELRRETLQQCRIFSKEAEVMLWKVGQRWQFREIKNDKKAEHLDPVDPDENQILWGTQVEKEIKGFTLVSDGSQGLRHAVPLFNIKEKFEDGKRPLRLTVRHYIKYDEDTGVARIYLSRLVNLFCTP